MELPLMQGGEWDLLPFIAAEDQPFTNTHFIFQPV